MPLSNLQKQAVAAVMAQYQHKFSVDETAIDLREMAKNFSNGIIPSEKIAELINAILDNRKNTKKAAPRASIDPRKAGFTPKFAWIGIVDTAINPIFQRDVAANHVGKIELVFDPKKIIVPCAIKDVNTGKYLIWDGHHTVRVCERQGWSHIPIWYIEADTTKLTPEEAERELILLAGRAFLAINEQNKRPVSPYDSHYISYECGEPEAVILQNIVASSRCRVARNDSKPGNITHVSNLKTAYALTSPQGMKGVYLNRTLAFHRKVWPHEAIRGVTMLSLAMMYQTIEVQTGSAPDAKFDTELAAVLKKIYGPSKIVAEELLAQYTKAWPNGRDSIPSAVMSGLMLTYTKHVGRLNIGSPTASFNVK